MQCFKPAWDKGFTRERNLKGWRLEGLIPFNRNALWCKKASLRASTGHIVVPSITPNANSASDSAAPVHGSAPLTAPAPAAAALDPSPEDVHVIGHVTERVQEAMDYIHKKPQIGQLTQEQLIAHVIRLQDSSDIVDEFAATRSEKPRADNQAKNHGEDPFLAIREVLQDRKVEHC